MLPVRKQIVGNLAVCSKYVTWAVGKARSLRKVVQYGTQNFVFDDARVEVHVVSDDLMVRIIELCPMPYVETAVLELGSFLWAYMKDVDSCKVHKAGSPDITADKLLGTIKLPVGDPYMSKIYKLKEPPTKLPVMPPPNQDDYRDDVTGQVHQADYLAALYPDQGALRRKKLTAIYLNPSKGTGKMRMFLQALCGSKLIDRVTVDLDKWGWNVIKATLDEYLVLDTTNYIVRDGNGEYWMLVPRWGQAYHMTFHKCADKIKKELKGGGLSRLRESQLEALLFAQMYVEPPTPEELERVALINEKATGSWRLLPAIPGWYDIKYPTEPTPTASHDWHFAYQKATAIRVRNEGKSELYSGSAEWYWYCGHLEELTFHTSADAPDELPADSPPGTPIPPPSPKPPTITWRELEAADWSPVRGYDFPWFIDPITHTQFTYDNFPVFKSDTAMDGPVYAFYNKDDEHIIARHKRGPADWSPAKTVTMSDFDACGFGTNETETTYPGGSRFGFYVTGAVSWTFSGVYKPSVGEYRGTHQLGGGGPGWVVEFVAHSGSTFMAGCENGAPTRWDSGTDYESYTAGSFTYVGCKWLSLVHNASGYDIAPHLICPVLDNPDAIYIGEQRQKLRNNTDYTVQSDGVSHVVIAGATGGTESGSRTQYLGFGAFANNSIIGANETPATNEYVTELRLITQHHDVLVNNDTASTVSYGVPGDTVRSGSWTFSKMFNRYPLDEYTVRLYANESINGKLWYTTKPDDTERKVAGGVPESLKDKPSIFIGYA